MRTPASLRFEECVLAVCGIQDARHPCSILSSLGCELTFNMLRDVTKRHAKRDKCHPAALHSVAFKAATVHNGGCESLTLTSEDWSVPLKAAQVKKAIHQNLRATDVELGISAEGLTKHRNAKQFTKPHIFTERLHLFSMLQAVWSNATGDSVDKKVAVDKVYDGLWLSKAVPELWFCQPQSSNCDPNELPDDCLLICKAGPYTVRCLAVVKKGDCYKLEPKPCQSKVVETLNKFVFAEAKADVSDELGCMVWSKCGPWISLTDYIADHSITTISVSLLLMICCKMGLKTSKYDHPHRVEFFLKHVGRSDDYVKEVLANLAPPRKRKGKSESIEEKDNKGSHTDLLENICDNNVW
eukprot:Skav209672  [mRNA]  locus=scaffold1603:4527:5591:- [translate_table: standard]